MKVEIRLGPMCDDLSKQLSALNLPEDAVKHLDLDKDAITRCHIRGLMTDREWENANKKLLRKIEALIGMHKGGLKRVTKPQAQTH